MPAQAEAAESSGSWARLRRPAALYAASVGFLAFAAAAWWSWRLAPLPDPFEPPSARSYWQWLTSPVERNAFRRALFFAGSLNGTCAVPGEDDVWAVGDDGLILYSPDAGRTWERKTEIDWVPTAAARPVPQAPGEKGASFLGLVRPAWAEMAPNAANAVRPHSPRALYPTAAGRKAQEKARAAEGPSPGKAEEQAPWKPPRPAQTTPLQAVAFAGEKRGIAVGEAGVLLTTADRGRSWRAVASGTDADLEAVAFADEGHALVVGYNGTVLRSSDGGQTWTASPSETASRLRSVAFADARHAVAVGGDGEVLRSSDGGETWEPVSRVTKADLASVAFANPEHALAVGQRGTILRSADGGQTWTEAVSHTESSLQSVAFADAEHAVAVGVGGETLRSSDGGLTWEVESSMPGSLESVAFVNAAVAIAVGAGGTIVRSSDAGRTWTAAARGGSGDLQSVAFVGASGVLAVGTDALLRSSDGGKTWTQLAFAAGQMDMSFVTVAGDGHALGGNHGGWIFRSSNGGETWELMETRPLGLESAVLVDAGHAVAVGVNGVILRSGDGGATWREVASGIGLRLRSVALAGAGHAVAVGEGGSILRSSDGGETWTGVGIVTALDLRSVVFADPDYGIAVGEAGTILRSTDGGQTWTKVDSKTDAELTAVAFADASHAVAVGSRGTVLRSSDRGQTWEAAHSTDADLQSVAFAGPEHGVTVGWGATILTSSDGGASWAPVTYARYPAPLFLLGAAGAFLVGFVGAWRAWREAPVEFRRSSVSDLFASDRPLRPGERDALGLAEIAAGISRFLRNRNTEPPLTIAVSGEWGSGKSSLMSLLFHDLKRRGFRPVWFNAWHHQRGEQLLASLFANIRAQAIPPMFSLEGLDFRWDLLRGRTKRYWVRASLGLLTLAFGFAYYMHHEASAQFLLGFMTPNLDDFVKQLKDVSLLGSGLIAAVLTATGGLLRALRAFGLNPKSLLGTVAVGKDGASTAQPGVRYRFARDFEDVTEALKPRPLVLFIDDLDRCAQDHVLEVLETINFLVSAGDCYVVLGMSRRWVETCVGLAFKELAAESPDDDAPASAAATATAASAGSGGLARDERRRFARHYLEKLINIEVPIPAVTPAGSAGILTPPRILPQSTRARWANGTAAVVRGWWLPSLMALMGVGGWYLASLAPDIRTPPTSASTTVPPAATSTPMSTQPTKTTQPEKSQSEEPDISFVPGTVDRFAWLRLLVPTALGSLALLALIVALITRRARVQTDDSDDFRDALEIMRPWIVLGHPTPRLLKRYVNHVRFVAMRQRQDVEPESLAERFARRARRMLDLEPAAGAPAAPPPALAEPHLVALSALQQARADWQTVPDWLDAKYGLLKSRTALDLTQALNVDPPDMARVSEALAAAIAAFNAKFASYGWQLFVDEAQDRAAIRSLVETMAGTRTDWGEGGRA